MKSLTQHTSDTIQLINAHIAACKALAADIAVGKAANTTTVQQTETAYRDAIRNNYNRARESAEWQLVGAVRNGNAAKFARYAFCDAADAALLEKHGVRLHPVACALFQHTDKAGNVRYHDMLEITRVCRAWAQRLGIVVNDAYITYVVDEITKMGPMSLYAATVVPEGIDCKLDPSMVPAAYHSTLCGCADCVSA